MTKKTKEEGLNSIYHDWYEVNHIRLVRKKREQTRQKMEKIDKELSDWAEMDESKKEKLTLKKVKKFINSIHKTYSSLCLIGDDLIGASEEQLKQYRLARIHSNYEKKLNKYNSLILELEELHDGFAGILEDLRVDMTKYEKLSDKSEEEDGYLIYTSHGTHVIEIEEYGEEKSKESEEKESE